MHEEPQSSHADIIIIGGGLVGLSLAFLLSHTEYTKKLSIVLLDANDLQSQKPSDTDPRAIALSYRSRLIYESANCWSLLAAQCCPITQIHVSQQYNFGVTRLSAKDHQLDALGYVISASQLTSILLNEIRKQSSVDLISSAHVSNISADDRCTIEWQGANKKISTMDAPLVLLAGGMSTTLIEKLGLNYSSHDFHQTAIVCNVEHTKPHENTAYERFLQQGIVAFLPIGKTTSSVIWTVSENREDLAHINDETYLAALQDAFGWRLGKLLSASKRQHYSVQQTHLQEQVHRNIIIMGNSAHTLHPVAGQGYNLALRDVSCLSKLIDNKLATGASLNTINFMADYAASREFDQQKTLLATKQLVKLFSIPGEGLQLARSLGLITLDLLPGLKKWFGNEAMGL